MIYTDGSMSEEGRVGGGWCCSEGGSCKGSGGLGRMATVWDGEVAGLKKALERAPSHWKILLLIDSQAAIAAAVKARKRGNHRTADLGSLVSEVRKRQEELGEGAVRLEWVKAHGKWSQTGARRVANH